MSLLTHRIDHRGYWPWTVLIVVLLGTAATNREAAHDRPVIFGVLLAVGAVVPALLRIGPAPALIASGALTCGYFALGYADGPVYLALPAVTLVAAWSSRVRDWVWPAAVAVTLVCAALAGRAWGYDDIDSGSPWQGIGSIAIVAAAGAVATALRARQDASRESTQRAATEERLRMAQDLHDGVGHGLAVIAMQAGAALHILDKDPAKARENLEAIRATSKESLEALRAELAHMSGDPAARRPAPGLDELDGLLDRVRGGGLLVDRTGAVDGLTEPVSRTAYAVVQESLTNVLRHADATRAIVSFERRADDLIVTVRDDGRGGTGDAGQDGGMGISGMRARVEALGGSLDAGPGPSGFRVRAVLPEQS